jgi:hypothetical protein
MEGVYKVYSGRAGACACGCAGKYSYTERGAVEDNPGYDVSDSVNERSVKIIMGKLLRNSNTQREDGMLILEQNGRVLIAYLAN